MNGLDVRTLPRHSLSAAGRVGDAVSGPASEASRLGNHGNRVSRPAEPVDPMVAVDGEAKAARQARRRERAFWRNRAREITELKRLRQCGQTTCSGTGGPTLRLSSTAMGPVGGYAGVVTCGSVWCCPVCAAKIAARRADQLAAVMGVVLLAGGSASMVTLTMRHHRGQRLKDCWDAASYAWNKVTSGKQWGKDQQVGGMRGWVRAAEVTHGGNGWHVHLHVLVVWEDRISLESARFVGESMHARWRNALLRRGFDSWCDQGGLDVRMAGLGGVDSLADYFVKLAREITSQATKNSRAGRTPFRILRDVHEEYLAADGDLWHEWEQASHNRRQLTWSTGRMDLRQWAAIEDATDEEIAEEEVGDADDDTLGLTARSWATVIAAGETTELIDALEDGGRDGAIGWLEARGLEWVLVRAGRRVELSPELRQARRESVRATLWKVA